MRLGYWASIGAFVTSVGYGIPQVLQVFGLLPTPLDRILIFAPSLALAPCFVLAMAAAYEAAPSEHRPLRLGALALALLYAAFVSVVYVNQLGVVIPRELAASAAGYGRLACCGFREPMTVIDLLGYTYMSLATLLLAATYRGVLRWALLLSGLLALPIFLQLFWPALIWVASPWLIAFPWAMLLLARAFHAEAGQRSAPRAG
jgi:hypothetical protein